MDFNEKKIWEEKEQSRNSEDIQQLEDAGRRLSTADEVVELSGIEDTAASKTAWLIS